MKNKLLIKTTSEYKAGDGIYIPSNRVSVNQRINHRADRNTLLFGTHINNVSGPSLKEDNSPAARKERYETNCLEKGIRPYNFPEHLWEEYLRDVEHEDHFNKCEAKQAWMYEF